MRASKKGKLEASHSVEEMNDLCPLIYVCKDKVHEWRCFGRYKGCRDYVAYVKRNKQ